MLREAIFHQSGGAYAYPLAKDILMVQLRTAKDDIEDVTLIYGDRYKGADATFEVKMDKYASDRLFDYYRARIHVATRKFRYIFYLNDGQEQVWYNELGFLTERPSGYHSGYFHYPYINDADMFEIPEWAYDAVVYQIFPERFYNGDKSNDPEGVRAWGELPKGQYDFFGGDLAGIIEKIPHIEQMGANLLYMTPIFEAPTNHKYDTTDYFKIDPAFGDTETLRRLVKECHSRGIKVMLDAVFNHCGYKMAQFQDVLEKGEASPYRDWFFIKSFPVSTDPLNYETFADVAKNMPKLNTANPEVMEFLIQVGEYWIKECDIDGWRLDVANEVDHVFWREFRRRMRALKPDFYLVGEIWHHSGEYLQGDQFDGIMNYHFWTAANHFFGDRAISVEEFNERLVRERVTYKEQAVYGSWNMLSSHDVERILSRFLENKAALRLAFVCQMTQPGVPFVYAGDEVGLAGKYDPDNRRCMIWEEEAQDRQLQAFIQKLIKIRQTQKALRYGDVRTISIDNERGLYVYERYSADGERVIVALNNSTAVQALELDLCALQIDPTQPLSELLYGTEVKVQDGILQLNIGAIDAVILG